MTRSISQSNDSKDVSARRGNRRAEWQKPALRRLASEEAMYGESTHNDAGNGSNEQS